MKLTTGQKWGIGIAVTLVLVIAGFLIYKKMKKNTSYSSEEKQKANKDLRLYRGVKAPLEVSILQEELNKQISEHDTKLVIDGIFGAKTEAELELQVEKKSITLNEFYIFRNQFVPSTPAQTQQKSM